MKMLSTAIEIRVLFPRLYLGASSLRYTLDAMIPEAWTNMLYKAADTVRERTALEFREFHATWIGCASGCYSRFAPRKL